MVSLRALGSLLGLLALLAGCRQPNPDWEGPGSADAADGVTSNVMTSGGSVDPSADVTGSMCQTDQDCAAPTPLCSMGACVAGGMGRCQANATCPADAPFCNPDGECQAGNEGDPCEGGAGQPDCSDQAPHCVDGICYDGSPGDPCMGVGECMSGTCTNMVCE